MEVVQPYVDKVDLILIMTVEPVRLRMYSNLLLVAIFNSYLFELALKILLFTLISPVYWQGAGGQKFMADMMPKVKTLRQQFHELDIEVDGGVSGDTIHTCAEVRIVILLFYCVLTGYTCVVFLVFQAGANLIVSGTAVVKSDNPKQAMDAMREAVAKGIPTWN